MSNKLVVSCALAILCISLIPTSFLVKPVAASTGLYVVSYNPYAGVDWSTTYRLKTELHAHTNLGGGGSYPYQVINNYAALGYDALGISDYNTLTWPWTQWWEFLSPAARSMVAIPNDEVADGGYAHFTAPFLTVSMSGTPYGSNVQGLIDAIIAANGVPIISAPVSMGFSLTTADSWTGFRGLEVYNPMDGTGLQPFSFQLWDHLLTDPARVDKHIWGLAVDDSHDGDLNKGWIVVYAAQKTAASMKNSIIAGSFVAVVNSTNSINNVTQVGNTLKVDATSAVVWRADGGQIVGTGSTLDLDALAPGYTYVRAEVGSGEVFTQPIFIRQTSPYTIFSNGFEDGLASWTGTGGLGYIDQSSDTAHSGSYSAKVSLIHYYGDKAYAYKSLGASFKRIDIRAYVNFSSDSTSGIMIGPLTLSSSDGYVASVVRNFTSSQWGVRIRNPTSGIETYYWGGTSALTLNKWYYFELEAVMSVHGFATLWIDGAMKLNATNFSFGANTISSVAAGEYETINDLSTNLKYYIDDVVVSDARAQYTLTATASPLDGGYVTLNNTGPYYYGDWVRLTVHVNLGWSFTGWSGDASGSVNPVNVLINGNKSVTANFSHTGAILTVNVSGNGATNATGTHVYFRNTNVTVLATPYSGWMLDHWILNSVNVGSMNPYTLNMTTDYTLTAVFSPSSLIPMFGWAVDPDYTNAAYVLNSSESNLSLELDATDTGNIVVLCHLNLQPLNISDYNYVDVQVTGSNNARIRIFFYLDDGTYFTIAMWEDPTVVNGTNFDLSPYAGRTLTVGYIELMSSDGTTANIEITKIAFMRGELPALIPLHGWEDDANYTNAPYVLSSTVSGLSLELDATDTSSILVLVNSNLPNINVSDYSYVDVGVTGSSNARIRIFFYLDDGSYFSIAIWDEPAVVNAASFDLAPYAGRSLAVGYVELMSSDGTTANIEITKIAFMTGTLPASIPLYGWENDAEYTNAPYVLDSTPSSLYLELDAVDTGSMVVLSRLNLPKLNISNYQYVDVDVTGSSNAIIRIFFYLDDGTYFTIAMWEDPTVVNAANFDLASYAGRTLTAAYIELMSADGTQSNITITKIAFMTGALPASIPLYGWENDAEYTNAPYVLDSTPSSLSVQLNATDTSSMVVLSHLNLPDLNMSDYNYVNVEVTGTSNARIRIFFYLDDGTYFTIAMWEDPTAVNSANFDLSPYAGRTLTVGYIELMSSDGTTVDITITQIAFITA